VKRDEIALENEVAGGDGAAGGDGVAGGDGAVGEDGIGIFFNNRFLKDLFYIFFKGSYVNIQYANAFVYIFCMDFEIFYDDIADIIK
jgi:hypothetical protein